jgi:hypothetical protein
MPCRSRLTALLPALLALGACATEAPHERRVMVKLAAAGATLPPELIAREAAHAAQLPVRHAAASGGGWHALAITCPSTALCDAAVERLRADPAYAAVERDERRGLPSPAPGAARQP